MDTLGSRALKTLKSGQPALAEELFTKAINISVVKPDIAYFDGRAACREKLGKLDEALTDAKRMLQLDIHDARGYLRAGKIYQIQNIDRKALECYERGRKAVARNDPLMKVILLLLEKVRARLEPQGRRCDPLMMLPLEIIWEIFSYFTFPQKLMCLQVSRHWSKVLTSDARFYTRLDLITNLKRKPKASSIEAYIKKSRGLLQSLATTTSLNPKSLQYHFTFCRTIHSLHLPLQRELLSSLPRAKNLANLRLIGDPHTNLSLDEMFNLLQRLPKLTSFGTTIGQGLASPAKKEEIKDSTAVLRHLELSTLIDITSNDMFHRNGSTTMLNLQILIISEARTGVSFSMMSHDDLPKSIKQLSFPLASNQHGLETISLPSELQHLAVQCKSKPFAKRDGMPVLQTLRLSNYVAGFQTTDWKHLNQHLKKLYLPNLRLQDSGLINAILGNITGLEELQITQAYADTFTDGCLQTVGQNNPHLRVLDVSHNKAITGLAVQALSSGAKSLQRLSIDGCDQIAQDIVRHIRGRGIVVSHRL